MAAKDRSELGNELHAFARARTMKDLAPAELSRLTELAGGPQGESIVKVVQHAVEQLPEAWMRGSAKTLLVGEERWGRTLGERQLSAGEDWFDLTSIDGWTRSQTNSLSYHDQLVESIAAVLLSPAPAQPANRRVVTYATLAAVIVAGLAIWLTLANGGDDVAADEPAVAGSATSTVGVAPTATVVAPTATVVAPTTTAVPSTPTAFVVEDEVDSASCVAGVGEAGASLSATQEDELARWSAEFVDLAGALCSAEPVAAFGDGLIQELVTAENTPMGALIVGPGSTPVYLTESQYVSYLEIAGRGNPENSRNFGGYPTSVYTVGSASVVDLSAGGLLAGNDPDQIHFWVSTNLDVRSLWEATGGLEGDLGLPMSNPFQPLGLSTEKPWYEESFWYQEYEFGVVVAPFLDRARVSIEYIEDRLAPLAGLDLRGELINQAGGQAWLIDAAGVAHWIPSLEVWECVNDGRALAMRDVPGYTIATFEQGPVAACSV